MGSEWMCTFGATDDGAEQNGDASALMTSPLKASNVAAELDIRMPKWFAKNVRHVWDGGLSRFGRYRDTVRSETVIPSLSSSPWIRGAPQRKLSARMRRMSA